MSDRVWRVGVVGLGGMGHRHASACREEPGVRLVAGCDVVPEKRAAWAAEHGVPASDMYEDVEQMLDRARLDVLIVATHAPAHAAQTVAAAQRGVHVFCEKPPALNLREADAMVAACDTANVKLAINHIKRGSNGNAIALRLVAQGAIGTPYLLRGEGKGGRWAGSELMEMGTHLFDWMRLIAHGMAAGDPQWLFAHLVHDGRAAGAGDIVHSLNLPYKERDCGLVLGQRAFAVAGFPTGLHAQIGFLQQPAAGDSGYGFDIVGTEGTLALRQSVGTQVFIQRGQHRGPLDSAGWEQVPVDELAGLDPPPAYAEESTAIRAALQRRLLRDLLDAVAEHREPYSSGRDGLKALELVMATWESQRAAGPVRLPLARRDHPLDAWLAEGPGGLNAGTRERLDWHGKDEGRLAR